MHLTKAHKELIVTLAACVGFFDTMQELEYHNCKKAKRSLKAAKNHAEKALTAIEEGVDKDHMLAVMRFARESYITVIPNSSPACGRNYYICKDEDMEVILTDALSKCTFCELEGKQARRCKLRKALISCGIVKNADGDCPYKGG